MKRLSILTVALLGMLGCTEETVTYINPIPGPAPSEKVAELAISSRNTWFTATDETNASIGFKSLGGSVVVDIATNVAWDCTGVNADWLSIEKDTEADQLVLSCQGNKAETEQQATVTVTAGDKRATIAVRQNPYGTLEIVASENNFRIPACGELTASFDVASTDEEWTFETAACSWMLVERDAEKIRLTFDANTDYADRQTTFTLIAGKQGSEPVTETITVLQDRAVYLASSTKTVPFSPTPRDAAEFRVEANYEWEYTLGENSDWLHVERTEQGLRLSTSTNNDGSSRSTTITLKAGDGKENTAEQVITVSQSSLDRDAFIIGLEVGSNDLTSVLPFDKPIDATIDWGDGTIEEHVTSAYPQHTYVDPNYYVVSVKGSVPSMNDSKANLRQYNQTDQYIEIYNWGRTGLTSMTRAFYDSNNLERIPTDNCEAFARVTGFDYAFTDCRKLEAIPEGLFRYAAELTSIQYTFQYDGLITSLPDDLFHHCPKLQNVNATFSGTGIERIDGDFFSKNPALTNCSTTFSNTSLKSIPAELFANNPGITTFNACFSSCAGIESVPEELFANNPEVTSFRMCFSATGLKEIPEKLFAGHDKATDFSMLFQRTPIRSIPAQLFSGCSKAVNFMTCFTGCTQLESIPADLFRNSGAQNAATANTGFNTVFSGCTSLKEVPAGLFDGFTRIVQFNRTFENCTGLTTLPAGLFATNVNAAQFAGTFSGCVSLKAIPEGLFKGLSKVTTISGLFSGCTALEEVGANIIDGCSLCTNISTLFKGCANLHTISPDAFAGAPKINTVANLFEGCTSLRNVPEQLFASLPALATASSLFASSGIETLPAGLFANNPNITTISKMFLDCASLKSLPDGLFAGCSKIATLSNAFQNSSIETVGLLFGDITAAAKCDYIFSGCTALKSVPAGLFDGLGKASTFLQAFNGCSSLETLPAGLFNRNTAVTTYEKCFQNCTALQAVPSKLFGTTTKAKTLSYLFDGCTALERIAPDAFDGLGCASTTLMYAFQNCTSLQEVPSGLLKANATISTFTGMFRYCTGLRRVGSEVFNCTAATQFSSVFDGCTALEEVGEKLLVNPAKLASATNLFRNCSSLRSIPAGIFDECKVLKTLTSLFEGCESLGGESPYTIVDGTKYHLYDRTTDNAAACGFTAVTSAKNSFKGCTKLSDYAQIPSAWKE